MHGSRGQTPHRGPHERAATDALGRLSDRVLGLGPHVRYVAVVRGTEIATQERAGLSGGSTAESDFYEELLVNPTIVGIAARRGALDCGGLRFIVVSYGLFHQVVVPTPDGHVSVAVENHADPLTVAAQVAELLVVASDAYPTPRS